MSIARFIMFVLAMSAPFQMGLGPRLDIAGSHSSHGNDGTPGLVEKVRAATQPFLDYHNAVGYEPVLGCVSGPQEGAMGVHFINKTFLMDGTLDPTQPEALIYEFKDGMARLVGVEFIVFADVWHSTHAPQDVPILEGQLLHFNDSPNRFGLPAFYELHVWAWRDNPNGTFADWNTKVSCGGNN